MLYHLHISITQREYGGKKRGKKNCLDLSPTSRQNGCDCASSGVALWRNATYSRGGSNQRSTLLTRSKGIFIDTLALTLARGSELSVGGPGLLLSLPVIFSASELSYVIIYRNLWIQSIQPQIHGAPFSGEHRIRSGSGLTEETSY